MFDNIGSPARILLVLASGVFRTREREGGSSVQYEFEPRTFPRRASVAKG